MPKHWEALKIKIKAKFLGVLRLMAIFLILFSGELFLSQDFAQLLVANLWDSIQTLATSIVNAILHVSISPELFQIQHSPTGVAVHQSITWLFD
jgi:hypothetical protein